MAGGGHCIDLDAGAGGGEVVHVAGGALLPGVRRTVAHAGVVVPHFAFIDAGGARFSVHTDTSARSMFRN